MKLIIQIPCFNEEESIRDVIHDLPKKIDGIDSIEILIIDDGSTDATVETAKEFGVDHIISNNENKGLAFTFMKGIKYSLNMGADIIVNTDGDNQYYGDDIEKLVAPLVQQKADIVIGYRNISKMETFSRLKKALQHLGSYVVRKVSRTRVKDAPSGFRAYTAKAASGLNVFNSYTYTIETIIQAGLSGMNIQQIPVRTNITKRKSRLMKSVFDYVRRSFLIICRAYAIYRPFLFFSAIGSSFLFLGFLLGVRFLFFYLNDSGDGHIQSLILASILIGMGFQTILIAFISDGISANRKIIQEIRSHLLKP